MHRVGGWSEPVRGEPTCEECGMRNHCLVRRVTHSRVTSGRAAWSGSLPRQEAIHVQGDEAWSLLIVRSGGVKLAAVSSDGREHVLGFCLPGDVLGIEWLQGCRYATTATTLERSSVCAIRGAGCPDLSAMLPAGREALLRATGEAAGALIRLRLYLHQHDASRRLDMFLLDRAERLAARGFDATDLRLNMTRHDIGSYLAMAPETVSRKLTELEDRGIIELGGRNAWLRDRPGLDELARGARAA